MCTIARKSCIWIPGLLVDLHSPCPISLIHEMEWLISTHTFRQLYLYIKLKKKLQYLGCLAQMEIQLSPPLLIFFSFSLLHLLSFELPHLFFSHLAYKHTWELIKTKTRNTPIVLRPQSCYHPLNCLFTVKLLALHSLSPHSHCPATPPPLPFRCWLWSPFIHTWSH